MVLKLYGSAMSTARVLVTILELGLPYEFTRIDIAKGEHNTAEYKTKQPFGKVPALNDEGFWMFESRAICRYLARKYPSGASLLPPGSDEAYARFEQACSVEQSYFAAAAETIGTEVVIRPSKGLGPPDEARVAQAEQDLDAVLAFYEGVLQTQSYLAGNELSLVDLFHLPAGAALKAGRWREVFRRYPAVDRWFTGLQGREAWKKAAAEAGTME